MGDVIAFVASGADGSRRVPMLLQLGARATSSEIGLVIGLKAPDDETARSMPKAKTE